MHQSSEMGSVMKIVICGKGGSGKSTVSALLSKSLANKGYRVLLIDADESNLGLHRMVGIDPPCVMMDSLGGKKGFKEKTRSSFPPGEPGLFADTLTVDDLSAHCRQGKNGVSLMAIGKIHEPGEGCACPMGSLSRMILSRLVPGDKDMVIIDTAAGVEHFGRGIDSHSDLVVGVIEPSYESLVLAEKMAAMAEQAELEIVFILNKVEDKVRKLMEQKIQRGRIIAEIGVNEDIFMAGIEGRMIQASPGAIDRAADWLINMKNRGKGSV